MTPKLWKQFVTYGSGFTLEAERDYDLKHEPLIYHLHMFGLVYPTGYELVGHNLDRLLKKAIKDGQIGYQKLLKPSRVFPHA